MRSDLEAKGGKGLLTLEGQGALGKAPPRNGRRVFSGRWGARHSRGALERLLETEQFRTKTVSTVNFVHLRSSASKSQQVEAKGNGDDASTDRAAGNLGERALDSGRRLLQALLWAHEGSPSVSLSLPPVHA